MKLTSLIRGKNWIFLTVVLLTVIGGGVFHLYIWPTYLNQSVPTPVPTPTVTPSPTTTIIESITPTPVPTEVATPTPPPLATPKPQVSPTPVSRPTTYTVKSGDTLGSIAAAFGLSLSYLVGVNPQISNPNQIYPGQIIALTGTPTVRPTIAPTKPPSQAVKATAVYRVQTTQPVVFLTIDDGEYKSSDAATLMKADGLAASFFLAYTYIQDNPDYFQTLRQATGSKIENHTYSHLNLATLTYSQQYAEIQKGLTVLTQLYGQRPTLFRPPYGNFNSDTALAAGYLGFKTMVLWDVTVNNGVLAYVTGTHLRAGDIVLMHFRPTFSQDLAAFYQAMQQQGLHTELLENWVQ